MDFSFIIPAFNIEKYIKECVDSILAQIEKLESEICAEIILINDGSTDSTLKIMKENYGNYKNVIIIDKENGGPAEARNIGFDTSRGKYILYIDGDDKIRDGSLKELFDFCKESDADIVPFMANTYDGRYENPFFVMEEDLVKGIKRPGELLKKFLKKDYSFGWVVWHYVFKRNFLKKIGLRFLEGYLSEDIDYMLKIFLSAESCACYMGIPVYAYRTSDMVSITRTANFKFIKDLLHFVNQDINIIKEIKDEELRSLLYLNFETLLEVGLYYYSAYEREQQKELLMLMELSKEIYKIPQEYRCLIKRKERMVYIGIRLFGFSLIGHLWGIRRRMQAWNKFV